MRILFKPDFYSQQRQREKQRFIYPVLLAMFATYLKNQGNEIIWDEINDGSYDKVIYSEKQIDVSFLLLPHADRVLTKAMSPKYQSNGNFKFLPGTYIMSSNTCWWRKCIFCIERQQTIYKCREVENVISEIAECRNMGFREVFDDSGTFPIDKWLDEFLIKFNYNDIKISCNMRMIDLPYNLLKEKGFRMLLFGLESANQKTLDKINKGIKVEDIKYIIEASKAGLEPHISVMFGYPWEADEDAVETLKLVWRLLKKGYAKTAQASLYNPVSYMSDDWQAPNYSHRKYIKKIYNIWRSPQFWLNKLRDVHNINDLKYLWRCIKVGLENA